VPTVSDTPHQGSRPAAATVGRVLAATLAALTLLALAAPAPARAAHNTDGPTVLYAQAPCTPVYAAASKLSTLETFLLMGADVTAQDASATWTHAHFWGGVEGYIPSNMLGAAPPANLRQGSCRYPGLPDANPAPLSGGSGPWALGAQASVTTVTTLYGQPDATSAPVGPLAMGQAVMIDQWVGDSQGEPWYHLQAPAGSGWALCADLRLSMPDPTTQTLGINPIWYPIGGKGMWATNYVAHDSDIGAMVRAAKLAGITHVYAEVAISQFGFYAQNSLDRLLPAAHAAGLKVIAWVYPQFHSVSDDIRLSEAAARYKTPSGDQADGIAADIEGPADDGLMSPGDAFAYGQVLRGLLGPNELMVATVFQPRARPSYPYAALAASFNVFAPMDYWHAHADRNYSPTDVRRFVTTSLVAIRAAMGTAGGGTMPIEELGQTYDMFTSPGTPGEPLGTDQQNAPTPDEVSADMQVAHEFGCIGVSFFEWQTATQPQWSAIGKFSW
jgi:hypothetical protein